MALGILRSRNGLIPVICVAAAALQEAKQFGDALRNTFTLPLGSVANITQPCPHGSVIVDLGRSMAFDMIMAREDIKGHGQVCMLLGVASCGGS